LAGLALLVALAACGTPAEPPAPQARSRSRLPTDLPPSARATPAPPREIVHVVAPGETLYRISKRYGTTVQSIIAANQIADVRSVPVGARLRVPGARTGTPSSVSAAPRAFDAKTYASRDPRGRSAGPLAFAWPISGPVISEYGMRRRTHHDGIDIKAPKGTIVRAAEAGRVIHADNSLAGYGNMVILKHAGRLSTVYAHNRKLLVRVGDFVEKGDAIAEVGQTGNATTPHLHFEIRADGAARDPLDYLK
jgi:murein DD-endopeptidase MepM/ murein hydrolase activator NlpD